MTAQREWFEKDYYAALGVAQNASQKDVTKAYRRLARKYHPDANPNNAAAEERFKEISAAYDVLGDEARRREYDEVRRLGPSAFGGPGGGFRFDTGGGAPGADISDLLSEMFGRGRRGQGGVGPRRGADVEVGLTLDFADAVRGLTTTLHVTSEARCDGCGGSGAAPGTSPARCTRCQGRGTVEDNQGPFAFSSPCPACQGRGVTIDQPCPGCRGTGTQTRPREVRVRIPAGVDTGQRIRLKGRGAPGRNGGPAGDLFVVCQVRPHPTFGRDGDHLTVRVPVSYAEAALGAEVPVPTLDGTSVTLRLRPGTQSGSRHRVKGRGIRAARREGDLIVTVDVAVPTRLGDAERAAIEHLAEVTEAIPR